MAWDVHKFGGSSLQDAERIASAGQRLLQERADRTAVVVSAMGGITDQLADLVARALRAPSVCEGPLVALEERTASTARALLEAPGPVLETVESDMADLRHLLHGIGLTGTVAPSTRDMILGFGELWSAALLHAWICEKGEPAAYLDAREVLRVRQDPTGPAVLWPETRALFEPWLASRPEAFLVITGFVARDDRGAPTTLRRNGSDYSAAIFAKLLRARCITIWTDVDGVMSADPRLVPEAVPIGELSYSEAAELAFFGAKVLHPQTLGPAVEARIPLRIRNASNPESPGTWIRETTSARPSPRTSPVTGLSSMRGMALLNLEGTGLIGVPGIARRLFSALHEVGISVAMISQASSEHSICLAVPDDAKERARDSVAAAFARELAEGKVQRVEVQGPYSILAAVGDRMVETSGVAAQLFDALARANVNVRAIAQGSCERNISVVVDEQDAARALRSAHAGFYLAPRTISMGIIGPGLVGRELLRQISLQRDELRTAHGIDLRVRAVANSRRMLLDDECLQGLEGLDTVGEPSDLARLAEFVRAPHIPHAVLVDCTASPNVAARYEEWLTQGMHVITPNKHACSGRWKDYERIRALGDRPGSRFLYEATVGAGLPVISTLRDLLRTGDRPRRIEGVLSGTLSFLLGHLAPDRPFSELVSEAARLGYTEPDPRQDLSGLDVARKAVILAREIGLAVELDGVPVEGLVPSGLGDEGDPEGLFHALRAQDGLLERERELAERKGQVLQYAANIDPDRGVSVGLTRCPATHPLATLRPGDNVIAFTTDRYAERPLIVQGPGAGPAVTAAGIFGDLLRLVSSLGGGP